MKPIKIKPIDRSQGLGALLSDTNDSIMDAAELLEGVASALNPILKQEEDKSIGSAIKDSSDGELISIAKENLNEAMTLCDNLTRLKDRLQL